MAQRDYSDAIRVVTELTASSKTYATHFTLWLGLGSAGGAVAMLSFTANLPDPDYALRTLLPAFGAFAFGVICSGASVLLASLRDAAGAEHHGHAYNRNQYGEAANATPEWFSSAPSQAEQLNANRNRMVKRNQEAHEQAEESWRRRTLWARWYSVATTAAALSFIIGITWPLTLVASGGSLKPKASAAHKVAGKSTQTSTTSPPAQSQKSVTQKDDSMVTQTVKQLQATH